MSSMLTKICGISLLVASIGLASCQALWVEAPGVDILIEQQG
ncbi:MAG: hypothetical protein ACR2QJ_14000 [Geminicoccaceae bacterium]